MNGFFPSLATKLVSSGRFKHFVHMGIGTVEKEYPKTGKVIHNTSCFLIVVGRLPSLHRWSVGCIALPKRHAAGRQMFRMGQVKVSFLVLRVDGNLEINRKSHRGNNRMVSRESFEHLVHEGQWKWPWKPQTSSIYGSEIDFMRDNWTTEVGLFRGLPLFSRRSCILCDSAFTFCTLGVEVSMTSWVTCSYTTSSGVELDRQELGLAGVEQPEVDRQLTLDEQGLVKLELD
ncbi:hypothetical protein Tco_0355685 [Tanacetum coccineum]